MFSRLSNSIRRNLPISRSYYTATHSHIEKLQKNIVNLEAKNTNKDTIVTTLQSAKDLNHQFMMNEHAAKKFADENDSNDFIYRNLSQYVRYENCDEYFSGKSALTEAVMIEKYNKDVVISIGEEPIIFHINWIGQRTPVDLGINAYLLDLSLTTSTKVLDDIQDIVLDNLTVAQVNDSDVYSIPLFSLEGEYDHEGTFEADCLEMNVIKKTYDYILQSAINSEEYNSLKEMTYLQYTWWLSYVLTHPSNWAFDRISVEINRDIN